MTAVTKTARQGRLLTLGIPLAVVLLFALVVPGLLEPSGPNLDTLVNGELPDAQTQTLDMVKELNAYLVSMVTLMFGALGWYLSQYRTGTSLLLRSVFFSTVGLLALAYWYAGRVYAEIAAELAQQALGVQPGASRILYWLELEFAASGTAGVLVLLVFADAVTRSKSG